MSSALKAKAPAKLILSGEHSVVYGFPALALAVNRYAESSIRSHLRSGILFNFLNLKYAKTFTLSTLFNLKHELQQQYHSFLEGKCSIREVLKRPFELLQYTVTNLLEKGNISLPTGVEIHTASDIPIGCGMGSSAASVMSILFALVKFFNLSFDPARFLSLGLEAENLQHGRSSGLDLHLALLGGCLKFENGATETRPQPQFPLRIVHTGFPVTPTGQCVAEVAPHFEKTTIGQDFGSVTHALDAALIANDFTGMQAAIRENHKLLVKIGVVPPRVQDFVRAIEKEGQAAKICGAGAVAGDKAGIVLVVSNKNLTSLIHSYGYVSEELSGDLKGARLVV